MGKKLVDDTSFEFIEGAEKQTVDELEEAMMAQDFLWSGENSMGEGANISLSSNISTLKSGIVLYFVYDDDTTNYGAEFHFIPKIAIPTILSVPLRVSFPLMNGPAEIDPVSKVLWIYNNKIEGDAINISTIVHRNYRLYAVVGV